MHSIIETGFLENKPDLLKFAWFNWWLPFDLGNSLHTGFMDWEQIYKRISIWEYTTKVIYTAFIDCAILRSRFLLQVCVVKSSRSTIMKWFDQTQCITAIINILTTSWCDCKTSSYESWTLPQHVPNKRSVLTNGYIGVNPATPHVPRSHDSWRSIRIYAEPQAA